MITLMLPQKNLLVLLLIPYPVATQPQIIDRFPFIGRNKNMRKHVLEFKRYAIWYWHVKSSNLRTL